MLIFRNRVTFHVLKMLCSFYKAAGQRETEISDFATFNNATRDCAQWQINNHVVFLIV